MASSPHLVLIVDDTPATLRMLSEHLEEQGFSIAIANDGDEAIERARKICPSLILMDVMMPGLDGVSAARIVNQDSQLKGTPVILMTSLHDTDAKLEGFDAGAVDYVTKPLNLQEVTARIRSHIRLRELQFTMEEQNLILQKEIGKRAEIENLLRDSHALLEQRVHERTEQLQQSNRLLSREVEERRKVESVLRANEDRLRLLYEENPAIYFTLSPSGSILSVNPHGAAHFGYPVSELVQKPVQLWTHPDDRVFLSQRLKACLQSPGTTFQWELRRLGKDNKPLVVQELGRATRQSDGTPIILIVSEDITERQRLEAQLRQVQKMDAFGQLAGGVAHDFNNILTVILGQAQCVDFPDVSAAEQAAALREISQAAHRASRLTRQLLVFSRRHEMIRKPLDLNQVVTDLAKMVGRFLGANIALDVNLCSIPLTVNGDGSLLEQVLLNLCINARDAMPQGGKLQIGTARRTISSSNPQNTKLGSPLGEYASVSVRDTGTGIAEEHIGQIFEPFFSTKEEGQGTGLGLTTSQSIVQQHGGWIDVVSKPGTGSEFSILLPLTAVAPLQESKSPEKITHTGNACVLLAEDEPGVRKSTAHILRRSGYTVLEATDAADALRIWEMHSNTIDLLLTDIVMPGEYDGHALAAKLQEFRPELRVSFMSGYNPTLVFRTKQGGRPASFLQKPFSVSSLLQFVADALANT